MNDNLNAFHSGISLSDSLADFIYIYLFYSVWIYMLFFQYIYSKNIIINHQIVKVFFYYILDKRYLQEINMSCA